MKYPRILCLYAWVMFSLTPCFAHHMAVVVNKENKVQNVTSAHLAKIFRGEVKKWPDGRSVVLVLHNSSPDEITTLEHLNKMTEAQVKALLALRKDSLRTVGSDADVIDAVASTPGAIGFVEERSITDRVSVVKVDGKLPMESGSLPHSPRFPPKKVPLKHRSQSADYRGRCRLLVLVSFYSRVSFYGRTSCCRRF